MNRREVAHAMLDRLIERTIRERKIGVPVTETYQMKPALLDTGGRITLTLTIDPIMRRGMEFENTKGVEG
jgi:hypothetical protein